MKKNYFLGSMTLLALAISAQANAATWSGAYAGGNIGYGWGKADTNVYHLPPDTLLAGTMRPTTMHPKPDGAVLGGQIGFNWQNGNQVTGVEADVSGADMRGTQVLSPFILNNGTPYAGIVTVHQKVDWFGTLRGRIGLATANNWLIYATGGLAFGGVKFSGDVDSRPGAGIYQFPASSSKTKTGWALGAGAEWAISDTRSVKVEYLHIDLGSQSAVGASIPARTPTPFLVGYDWKTKADILRIGMNFKF